jgi:hypothetical protein
MSKKYAEIAVTQYITDNALPPPAATAGNAIADVVYDNNPVISKKSDAQVLADYNTSHALKLTDPQQADILALIEANKP